jgi:hypothetical protein
MSRSTVGRGKPDYDWLVYEWRADAWWPANGGPTVADTGLHAIDERRILPPTEHPMPPTRSIAGSSIIRYGYAP